MTITEAVKDFMNSSQNLPDGRYKSWEYCFDFFSHKFDKQNWDYAALMLGFYLASWGMYRGSSFLLQYTYTIHIGALKIIFSDKYASLQHKRNINKEDVDLLFQLIQELKQYYFEKNKAYSSINSYSQLSDTLISKILMGVLGNIPAYDRYVKEGLKQIKISQTMSKKGYIQLLEFYYKNKVEIDTLEKECPKYTPMKLIDMYLWNLGQKS